MIRFRRSRAISWASKNPTLGKGEPGYDTTNKRVKVGDGVTPWNDLPYLLSEEADPRLFATASISVGNVAGVAVPDMKEMLIEVTGPPAPFDTVTTPPFVVPADARFRVAVIPPIVTSGELRVSYASLLVTNPTGTQYRFVGCDEGMDLPNTGESTNIVWDNPVEGPAVGADLTLDGTSTYISTTAGGLFIVAATVYISGVDLVV